ncbi:diacylglycerol O-acyltransferase 1 [Borealophlyctis nickersoniae]|nr:diacylglycerol O-acyltransferase 1 [Borealophlyctis nickersoniae]
MPLLETLRSYSHRSPETAERRKLYKTKRKLGEGTYGVVKEAVYLPTGRTVALKSIGKQPASSGQNVREAVTREMTCLKDVRHANIIAMLDFFETRKKYYLVFEIATGGGVDLKPENLLYRDSSPEAELVIADFGVSNFVHGDNLLMTLCGSPMYAAPEVLKRSGHSKPADLWSIGVITYTVLVGYPPFDYAEDFADLVEGITHGRWKFDSPYWDQISEDAKDFIKRLMQLKPNDRATAREAMLHPWLIKYSVKAREYAKSVRAALEAKIQRATASVQIPPRVSSTDAKADGLAPAAESAKDDLPHRAPSVRSKISLDEQELPNLASVVWPMEGRFNAQRKLKQMEQERSFLAKTASASALPSFAEAKAALGEDDDDTSEEESKGIIALGAWINFITEAGGFSTLFPGIKLRVLTLRPNFNLPIYRDLLVFLGLSSVSRSCCDTILSKGPGNSILIVIGGAKEALGAHPYTNDIILKKRMGFVKMALEHGASLVPVFSFGENDIWNQIPNPPGSLVRSFQLLFHKYLTFSPPFFFGRGVFNYSFGVLPFRRPIVSVVGEPIHCPKTPDPPAELIAEYHQKYVDGLMKVYEENKEKYAPNRKRELEIVE